MVSISKFSGIEKKKSEPESESESNEFPEPESESESELYQIVGVGAVDFLITWYLFRLEVGKKKKKKKSRF